MTNLIILKIIVSTLMVMGLSLIVEHASPRVAGVLSGYPLGTAIILFFFGIEEGTGFAASSAVFALIGLIASQAFVFFYYKVSMSNSRYVIVKSSLVALLGYIIIIFALRQVTFNLFLSICCPVVSILIFSYMFRFIENGKITTKVTLTLNTILLRAVFTASIVLIITALPKLIGSTLSGLFSSFPTTLFPLLLIVHLTYEKEHVHTIIKNFPLGLGSLIVYCLSVAFFYPLCGVYLGTFVSFFMATGYLVVYYGVATMIKNKREIRGITSGSTRI